MFLPAKVQESYKNLIGWEQHYDTDEISISEDLTTSESGEYFQDVHAALRLDIIQALIPQNRTLNEYLESKTKAGIVRMLHDLINYRQLNQYGKTLLESTQLLNKVGMLKDTIINENRFVGFQISTKTETGIQAFINQIGFQFTGQESFKLYLFHSSKSEPVKEFDIVLDSNSGWHWQNIDQPLDTFLNQEYQGGVFVLGYYQDDIVTSAINNTGFDWNIGACSSCNPRSGRAWESINRYVKVKPLYVPQGSYVKGQMFDLEDAFADNARSYGLNLKINTRCDLTSFFVENKFAFKNLLGYKVAEIILGDMKMSQQINFIEENIKMMIIREHEGDTQTRMKNITRKYEDEIKAVSYNISGINSVCLPCTDESYSISLGVA